MEHIAKFLDLLKARPGQLGGLAAGAGALAWLLSSPLMPPSSEDRYVWVAGAAALACLAGGLSIGATCEWMISRAGRLLSRKLVSRRNRATFRAYLPFLNAKERQILGFLLHYRQKTFEMAMDGGYASGLLSRGFVQFKVVPGQIIEAERVVAIVPEDVWLVIEENAADFPHTPEFDGSGRDRVETFPWRVPWMLR